MRVLPSNSANYNAYANIYTAFNNRTRGFSDEVRFGIEGGVTFAKEKLIAIIRALWDQDL